MIKNLLQHFEELYNFSCSIFPIVRYDFSVKNDNSISYNGYIDNGNSLLTNLENKNYILNLLKNYVSLEIFEVIKSYIFIIDKEVSLGYSFENGVLEFDLSYISQELNKNEVIKISRFLGDMHNDGLPFIDNKKVKIFGNYENLL